MEQTFVLLQASAAPAEAAASELGYWALVANAPIEVKALILVLAVMSLVSWFIIGAKLVRLVQASGHSRRFLDLFWAQEGTTPWAADRLESVYSQVKAVGDSPLAKVFHAGYVELARLTSGPVTQSGEPALENVERALRRASVTEMTRLEAMLPFLATTGSTAPFIGLLGTVLGILHVFRDFADASNVGLEHMGPKIAEALLVTAIGLVAAIPALVAYNAFVQRLRRARGEMEDFTLEFLNLTERNFM